MLMKARVIAFSNVRASYVVKLKTVKTGYIQGRTDSRITQARAPFGKDNRQEDVIEQTGNGVSYPFLCHHWKHWICALVYTC